MRQYLSEDAPVLIWTGTEVLDGRLTVPRTAPGVVMIASLGGTNHHDGYRALAQHLNLNGYATFMVDLLTPDEQQIDARTGHFRSGLTLLAMRIVSASRWLENEPAAEGLPQAFAASNVIASAGALAAANGAFDAFAMLLVAPRLDLVRDVLPQLAAPLLIAGDGGAFDHVSERDLVLLRCEHRVVHVENVTPFLEDPAARAGVLDHAIEWLLVHEPAVPERA
jgi:putative phosphoribosyl transferase